MGAVDAVTTYPLESKIVTTGSVGNVEPDAPAAGWVVNCIEAARPVMLKGALAMLGKPELDASKVNPVPNLLS
jgi:hypothetical protein